MLKHWRFSISTILIIVFYLGLSSTNLKGQNNNAEDFEVYLDFRHRGIINSVVISYYKNDEFYLPISELFSLFDIDHSINGLIVDGKFGQSQIPYRINLNNNQIKFGEHVTELTADDYLVKEIDFYLRADIFYEAFALNFTIDFNNLVLNLETQRELPAVQQAIRSQRRQLANENRYQEQRYELRYDRQRPFLDGGFIDYNLSANVNSGVNVYNLNTNLGVQLYGGDLQGSVFGSYSENFTNVATDNLRWRYMFRDKPWLTKLTIGQTTTDGFARNAYTGVRITNEPIEPRRLFDEFVVQGNTIPQSEVELYMNNALIDFQQSDELGNYRFLTPITYGSSQLDLKIYGPTGQIIERSDRIQIPFTFQPEGVFNYSINAGRLDNPIFGETSQDFTAQGNGAYGITDWLTAKTGVEYYQGYHDALPTFTSSLSSRIASNYILTVEAATDAYYRGYINVIYPNSASLNIDYTDFTNGFSIYNPSNDDKRLVASVFYPFNFWGLPFNVRASTFSRIRPTTNNTTIRFDANSRIGKLNLRVGYSDRFVGDIDLFNPTNTAYLETSATYNISRNRNLPSYLRGVFLRAQMRYQPTLDKFDSAEFLISQNVFDQGRLQLSLGRNFAGEYNTLRFSLVVDLDKARSSTTFSNIRGNNNFTQNIRGSVGYDTNYNNFIFTSRDQVGRSGTAIQLFVDNNNNGSFDDGDDPIRGNAVRVQRSGAISQSKNGVLYYTQMQPYFYYNMEMNKGAIQNPMLIPEFEKFGLITDPNRFKKVEVPFYMSGVIEGIVRRQSLNGQKMGVAGLKVLLTQENGDFSKELRTFSDGSFYDYEVPPGEYVLEIDPSQLDLLGSKSIPEKIEFEVQAIPEGDFVEGLEILLVPKDYQANETSITAGSNIAQTANNGGGISLEYNIAVDSLSLNKCRYGVQLGAFSTFEAARKIVKNYSRDSNSYVVYNEPRKLYAVRTGLFQDLGRASQFTQNLTSNYPDAAVLNQCYETVATNYEPGGIRYDLQFAAFTNPYRADSYLADLKSKYQLDPHRYRDPESLLYKVRLGPFSSLRLAEQERRKILNSSSISDVYISKQELPASMINVDFEFILQLGEFETDRKAVLYAIRVEEEFELNSKILVDEREKIVLVVEDIYTDWEEVLSVRKEIMNNSTFKTPIIHLLEQKNDNQVTFSW
ncbi:SPOR domain-containing protein [Gracilimonas sp.]|uniref:SPOR domain-containing protein n=1 Tax=Gracilimonas sp. TaxID=1974203 RepID=UPI0032EE8637